MLIAFECFASAFFELHTWLALTVLLDADHQFVPIHFCCTKLVPAFIVAFAASFSTAFFISLDRLISVLFPMWYSQSEHSMKVYLVPMLCSLLICPAIMINAVYQIVATVPDTIKSVCAPHECVWDWASEQVYMLMSAVNLLTLINYTVIWIVLRWRAKNSQQATTSAWTHRILKTLGVLMALNLVGHSLNGIARITVQKIEMDVLQTSMLTYSLSCLTNFVMASNAPVLFIFNQDYRKAFQKAFKLKSFFSKNSKIATAVVQSAQNNNNFVTNLQLNNNNIIITNIVNEERREGLSQKSC